MEWKIKRNDDCELVAIIRQALKENDGYCPCAVEKKPDTICPCLSFREQNFQGQCHCGLYEKY